MSEPELTCKELVELVNDYLFGALSASDRARFELHVTTCDACAAFIAQMQTTVAVTGRLSEDSLDGATRRELLAMFRDWKAGT